MRTEWDEKYYRSRHRPGFAAGDETGSEYDVEGEVNGGLTESGLDVRFLIAGFACGVLFGAAVGLIMAPAKGVETRRRLAEGAGDARRYAVTVFDRAQALAVTRTRGLVGLAEALRKGPRPVESPQREVPLTSDELPIA